MLKMLYALTLLLAAAPLRVSAQMTPVPLSLGTPALGAAAAAGAGITASLSSPLQSGTMALPRPLSAAQTALPQVRAAAFATEKETPKPAAVQPRAATPARAATTVPGVPAGTEIGKGATPEELDFAAKASVELALLAEAVGEERGMKASKMSGKDFLDMLEGGRERYALQKAAAAPSPEAFQAALTVQNQVLRWVSKLLAQNQPLYPQIRRVLAVWDVFNQEMSRAAEQGTLKAVTDDAELFATQVENS